MNAALWFLTRHLFLRGLKQWLIRLSQPGRLIGVCCLMGALWSLYVFRNADFIRDLIQSTPLSVVIVLAVFLSVARGLTQRGLRFDPPDIEFVCCGPFTERSILLFRMIPSYGASLLSGLLVYLFFGDQFQRPVLASVCVFLVHVLSVHLTMLACLYAGTIPESSLRVLRRALWAVGLVTAYVFFRSVVLSGSERVAERSPVGSFVVDVGALPMMSVSGLVDSSLQLASASELLGRSVLVKRDAMLIWGLLGILAMFIGASFRQIMGLRGVLFESSVAPVSERRSVSSKPHQGRGGFPIINQWIGDACFSGSMALVWKNLICARRSIPRLLLALFYTAIVVLPWLSIFLMMRQSGSFDPWAVNGALPLTLAALPLILQTTVPFDFRLDGHQLSQLKVLPFSGIRAVLGIIAVPVGICVFFPVLGAFGFSPDRAL